MSEFTHYPAGTMSWIDLATQDRKAAKAFYGELMGWTFEDKSVGDNQIYTMALLKGKIVAGLLQLEQEMAELHPHWRSYITVGNADETATKARLLGAQKVEGPFNMEEGGRMAVIQDPSGAFFMVWEPKDHIGAAICNVPGSWTWNELATKEAQKARDFYTKLFSWKYTVENMGDFDYTSFQVGDRMNAGIIEMDPEWRMPPQWGVYFSVRDCDTLLEKAKKLGALVLRPPSDIPKTGRFAVLQDPQGAIFHIIASPS